MCVPRETVAAAVRRFPVADPNRATDQLLALLEALAAEPDPPTTVRDPRQALDVHVADSLAGFEVSALHKATRIADIGAGAGFPGLVLAIALPEARVDLVEATRRKCEVIDRLATAANIDDRARAIPARAEDWARTNRAAYDVVTARALAPLAVLAEYAAPLLRHQGALVTWKGARDEHEEQAGVAAATQLGLEPTRIVPVTPYEGSHSRHLHVYSKVSETPPRFPRRPGMAAKKPLA